MSLQSGRALPDGDRIRRLREERGWTQEELGRRAGIKSTKTISRLEASEPCYLNTLNDVAAAFEVAVALLLQPGESREPVHVELTVQKIAARMAGGTRMVGIQAEGPTFSVGDRIRLRSRVTRECDLWVVNIGASGERASLLPNLFCTRCRLAPNEWHDFPAEGDRYSFPLLGPPGLEKILAIALTRPAASADSNLARVTSLVPGDELVDKSGATSRPHVLGTVTVEFEVTKAAT